MIGVLEIRRRKLQFGLIASVVALIAYLVLAINGLGQGLNAAAAGAISGLNADAIAFSAEARQDLARSQLTSDQVEAISSQPTVTASGPLSYSTADYRAGDGSVKSAGFFGFTPGTLGEPEVVSGRKLTAGDTTAILGDRAFLKTGGLSVGDTVEMVVGLQRRSFEIVGEVDEGQLVFSPVVFMLQASYAELRYGSDAPRAPAGNVLLLRGNGLTGVNVEGVEIRSKDAVYEKTLGGISVTVRLLQGFAYAIGAAVIGVFFYVLTVQKVGQIGVLKAVGASNLFVFQQLILQVLTITAAGLAIALPLGLLTALLLSSSADGAPFSFTPRTFVVTALSVLLTAVVGAGFSGRRVVKTDPIIALGQQQ
jgi:putative ABC transport system permease protein